MILRIFLAFIIVFFTFHHLVFAHKLVVEEISKDEFLFRYDDGTAASLVTVSGYDRDNELLFTKKVRHDGTVMIDSYFHRIVGDDGIGHRVAYLKQSEVKVGFLSNVPNWLKSLLGISLLLCIASFFHFRKAAKQT